MFGLISGKLNYKGPGVCSSYENVVLSLKTIKPYTHVGYEWERASKLWWPASDYSGLWHSRWQTCKWKHVQIEKEFMTPGSHPLTHLHKWWQWIILWMSLKMSPNRKYWGNGFQMFLVSVKDNNCDYVRSTGDSLLSPALPASYLTSHFTSLDVYFIKPELIIHMSHT